MLKLLLCAFTLESMLLKLVPYVAGANGLMVATCRRTFTIPQLCSYFFLVDETSEAAGTVYLLFTTFLDNRQPAETTDRITRHMGYIFVTHMTSSVWCCSMLNQPSVKSFRAMFIISQIMTYDYEIAFDVRNFPTKIFNVLVIWSFINIPINFSTVDADGRHL